MSNNGNKSESEMEKLLPKGLFDDSPRTRQAAEESARRRSTERKREESARRRSTERKREESARRRSAVRRKAAANYEAAEEEQGSMVAAMFDREMDVGIFFDNDPAKIAQVRDSCRLGNITRVQVKESYENPNKTINTELLADKPRAIDKDTNLYYKLHTVTKSPHIFYDRVSGVHEEHVRKLHNWEKATRKAEDRYAFFDWDRTLSMNEGLIFPPPIKIGDSIVQAYARYKVTGADVTEEKIYEDMSEYLAGGRERLAMLREMFQFLRDSGVRVVILTNNGSCVLPDQVEYFKKLVYKFVGYKQVEFLCTKNTANPAQPWIKGDKGYALTVTRKYMEACLGRRAQGGRRQGNKTKKNRQRN